MTTEPVRARMPVAVPIAHMIMDGLVLALVFWSAGRLSGESLPVPVLGGLFAGWLAVLAAGEWLRARQWRMTPLLELAAGGLVLVALERFNWRGAAPAGQLLHEFGAAAAALAGWRAWRDRSAGARNEPMAEPGRVLVLAGLALGVLSPLITDHHVGGTDARWYAYMLHDFLGQWRSGGPPVFLGQGEYVWNGAVHPFRSAPVYMHVAGLWDWLTLQRLSTLALQHLTAITAAVAGVWGVYAAGVKLAPERRWESAAVAGLYGLSPAALLVLYVADAYMTYLASAVYVWVFYGNIRLLTGGRGWVTLAAGLSCAWMCHPPTAMHLTLISAALQLGRLAFSEWEWAEWGKAAAAAAWFAGLSLYYFVGMGELPGSHSGLGSGLGLVATLMAGWFAVVRVVFSEHGWRWSWLLGVVALILWRTCPAWLGWLGLGLGLLAGFRFAARRWGDCQPAAHGPLVAAAAILLAAWGMDWLLREGVLRAGAYAELAPDWSEIWKSDHFRPLTASVRSANDVQPGWGLWLMGIAAGVSASRRGAIGRQLLFGALALALPVLLHWPGTGRFMMAYLPLPLVAISGMAMELRMMPVYSALLAMAGLLALRSRPPAGSAGPGRRLAGAGLALLVIWAVWQGRLFVLRGQVATAPAAAEAKNWRSENAPMDRFVYDLLPIPSYFSHGKMDPRLEVRLIDDRGNLIYGPPQMVEAMEAAGRETIGLDTHSIPGHPEWLQLEPRFTLQPGEHRLLRFAFDPARRYAGYLLLVSERGYREYYLPDSGMRRAFGTGPENSRVISLWNSGTEPEHYHMQFQLKPGHDLAAGMHFAMVTMSAYRPDQALIGVESINPLRVRTRLPWSGQLETMRVFLPGYEVRVDGRRVKPSRLSASPDRLLQIAMPPGDHLVEVRFAGTWKLRLAGVVSLAAWGAFLAGVVSGGRGRLGRLGDV